jgi:hypothetical protein
MATVVDGIMRLISSQPRKDSNEQHRGTKKDRQALVNARKDGAPLRSLYGMGNDRLLYSIVENYLKACNEIFWSTAALGSYIRKTVGVQALFDVLKRLAPEIIESKDARAETLKRRLLPAQVADFSVAPFNNPSGAGRAAIRNEILRLIRLTHVTQDGEV